MARVTHFEVHAADPDRAVRFYTAMLDWQFSKWDGPAEYWVITTGPADEPGINGGLVRRRGDGPAEMQAVNAFVCTAVVKDLDSRLAKLGELGGTIAVPKMPIPGVGWLAYAKDTEGNIFGMMQNDPTATM